MGCFVSKEPLQEGKIVLIRRHKKWLNPCIIMRLGATKVNGWLEGNTSTIVVLVEQYTNRMKY